MKEQIGIITHLLALNVVQQSLALVMVSEEVFLFLLMT